MKSPSLRQNWTSNYRIVISKYGLNEDQREMDEFERCYHGNLFSDRSIGWDEDYDERTRTYIKQERRKPFFEDSLAKKIIDAHTGHIFGYDKFPTIIVNTVNKEMYSDDIINKHHDESDAEPDDIDKQKLKVVNFELQKFANTIFSEAHLNTTMLDACRTGLQCGKVIIVFKMIDGKFHLEVINPKWVTDLVFDDRIPYKVKSFTELYQYQGVDPLDRTKIAYFWYKRVFNEEFEIEYEPLIDNGDGMDMSNYKFKIKKDGKQEHGLGFCPAVFMHTPGQKSVLHGQIDNIKSYIYMTNNIYKGIRANMDPQWALMADDGFNDSEPKRKGNIWVFYNTRDIKAISPDTKGYEQARLFRQELKHEILEACRVLEVPADNNQSGAALKIRLAPQLDAVGEYKSYFGDRALVKLCTMMITAAIIISETQELALPPNVYTPSSDDMSVGLDWGDILPVTEDTKSRMIENATVAREATFITWEAGVRYIAPAFGISDVDQMIRQLQDEKRAEEEEENLAREAETKSMIDDFNKKESTKEDSTGEKDVE